MIHGFPSGVPSGSELRFKRLSNANEHAVLSQDDILNDSERFRRENEYGDRHRRKNLVQGIPNQESRSGQQIVNVAYRRRNDLRRLASRRSIGIQREQLLVPDADFKNLKIHTLQVQWIPEIFHWGFGRIHRFYETVHQRSQ